MSSSSRAVTALLDRDWRASLGDLVLFEEIWKWGFGFGGFWRWCSELELLSAGARAFCRHHLVRRTKRNEFSASESSEILSFLDRAFIRLEAWFQWFNTTQAAHKDLWVLKWTFLYYLSFKAFHISWLPKPCSVQGSAISSNLKALFPAWYFAFTYFMAVCIGILTDQNKLVVAVGGATALAAGVYTTRNICMNQKRYQRRKSLFPSLIPLLIRNGIRDGNKNSVSDSVANQKWNQRRK
ncbi:hypothetical protein Syun_018592 [Stephania yunnanensis]|uniref:Uncharacterized protein n=1 Tax=Stephania yunnanensis TaxID=152371 RepID=A0AAP0ITN1_9MAGN